MSPSEALKEPCEVSCLQRQRGRLRTQITIFLRRGKGSQETVTVSAAEIPKHLIHQFRSKFRKRRSTNLPKKKKRHGSMLAQLWGLLVGRSNPIEASIPGRVEASK